MHDYQFRMGFPDSPKEPRYLAVAIKETLFGLLSFECEDGDPDDLGYLLISSAVMSAPRGLRTFCRYSLARARERDQGAGVRALGEGLDQDVRVDCVSGTAEEGWIP